MKHPRTKKNADAAPTASHWDYVKVNITFSQALQKRFASHKITISASDNNLHWIEHCCQYGTVSTFQYLLSLTCPPISPQQYPEHWLYLAAKNQTVVATHAATTIATSPGEYTLFQWLFLQQPSPTDQMYYQCVLELAQTPPCHTKKSIRQQSNTTIYNNLRWLHSFFYKTRLPLPLPLQPQHDHDPLFRAFDALMQQRDFQFHHHIEFFLLWCELSTLYWLPRYPEHVYMSWCSKWQMAIEDQWLSFFAGGMKAATATTSTPSKMFSQHWQFHLATATQLLFSYTTVLYETFGTQLQPNLTLASLENSSPSIFSSATLAGLHHLTTMHWGNASSLKLVFREGFRFLWIQEKEESMIWGFIHLFCLLFRGSSSSSSSSSKGGGRNNTNYHSLYSFLATHVLQPALKLQKADEDDDDDDDDDDNNDDDDDDNDDDKGENRGRSIPRCANDYTPKYTMSIPMWRVFAQLFAQTTTCRPSNIIMATRRMMESLGSFLWYQTDGSSSSSSSSMNPCMQACQQDFLDQRYRSDHSKHIWTRVLLNSFNPSRMIAQQAPPFAFTYMMEKQYCAAECFSLALEVGWVSLLRIDDLMFTEQIMPRVIPIASLRWIIDEWNAKCTTVPTASASTPLDAALEKTVLYCVQRATLYHCETAPLSASPLPITSWWQYCIRHCPKPWLEEKLLPILNHLIAKTSIAHRRYCQRRMQPILQLAATTSAAELGDHHRIQWIKTVWETHQNRHRIQWIKTVWETHQNANLCLQLLDTAGDVQVACIQCMHIVLDKWHFRREDAHTLAFFSALLARLGDNDDNEDTKKAATEDHKLAYARRGRHLFQEYVQQQLCLPAPCDKVTSFLVYQCVLLLRDGKMCLWTKSEYDDMILWTDKVMVSLCDTFFAYETCPSTSGPHNQKPYFALFCLSELRIVLVNIDQFKQMTCPICLEDQVHGIVYKTVCNHGFCFDCARKLRNAYTSSCPICRTPHVMNKRYSVLNFL